jgi:hypothetical protein
LVFLLLEDKDQKGVNEKEYYFSYHDLETLSNKNKKLKKKYTIFGLLFLLNLLGMFFFCDFNKFKKLINFVINVNYLTEFIYIKTK